jgi:hypothetical protein
MSGISFRLPSTSYNQIKLEAVGQKYTVQGQRASSYEYFVALAFDELELAYIFQYDVLGGRRRLGGFIIDFLVLTRPLSTPVWVNGEYYHRGKQTLKDKYQQALLSSLMRGRINPPVIFWGDDVKTKEDALASVRREMRL